MYSAVFFDRDGIINKYVEPTPRTKEEIVINDGIKETIQKLRNLGYKIVIVTNQPNIDRGLITPENTEEIHDYIAKELGTDAILIASSSDDKDPFRKPNPGMLLKTAKDMDIHLPSSYMLGDSWKDVEAGKRAGCHTIFLKTDYNQDSLEKSKPDVIISSLEAIYPVIFYGTYDTHYFNISRWVIQYSIREQGDIYDNIIKKLATIGDGRVFIMGCGGGAGNSSHAASDIRKICGIEAYSLTDNVSELTAWINDESWEDAYFDLLCTSNLSEKDVVVVFSVGGGSKKYNLSTNIIKALDYAKECGAYICGIVGRDGGYTKEVANDCVVLEVPEENVITPIVESLQMLIWHMIVTHPTLRQNEPEWEVREKWSFK